MSGAQHQTPIGTVVRLVIPAATVVAWGNLQLQVSLPGHEQQVVHLPLVDGHFRPLVQVEAYVPDVAAGQLYRTREGQLLFGVAAYTADGVPDGTRLISADGGYSYDPQQAVDDLGPLTLVGEVPVVAYAETEPTPAPSVSPTPPPYPGPVDNAQTAFIAPVAELAGRRK